MVKIACGNKNDKLQKLLVDKFPIKCTGRGEITKSQNKNCKYTWKIL